MLFVILFQSQAKAAEPSKVLRLEEITVRAKSGKISPPPPSSTIITGEDLKNYNVDKPLYIMERVPGVAIQDYSQGQTASCFVMRGLRLGHNTGVALFVDGVPINESTSHGDGYADFNLIIPEDIDYVEVIKGPSSALYGQFARAGVVNIVTKRRGNFGLYKLGAGSWGTQRFAMSAGHEDENFKKVFGVEFYHRDGKTDNTKWLRGNATGKFTYDFTKDLTGSIALNFNSSEWDAPEYLTRAQYDAGDYWSAKDLAGGEKNRYGGSGNLTYDITDESFLNFMFYGYHHDFTRYRDRRPDLTRGAEEESYDRTIYGGSLSYIWNTQFGSMENSLTLGADGQRELTETRKYRNPSLVRTAREQATVLGDSTIDTFSLFFQNQFKPHKAWKITLGGRYDHMEGHLENHLTNANTNMDDEDIFSPKAALEFTPFIGYTVFSTYGEGFRLPNGNDKFMFPDLEPEYYTQYELGLKLNPIDKFKATLTGFILDVDDEFVTDAVTGDRKNEGDTRRKGIELELNVYPIDNLEFYSTVSYTEGEYKNYINNGVDYSGTDIDRVPDWIFNFGVKWAPPQGIFAGFDARYVGEGLTRAYPANFAGFRRNTIDYWVCDAQLGYNYKIYSLGLDITNIFDKRYPAYESGDSLRTANPRGFFLTFTVSY